jgi:hypothetical protein
MDQKMLIDMWLTLSHLSTNRHLASIWWTFNGKNIGLRCRPYLPSSLSSPVFLSPPLLPSPLPSPPSLPIPSFPYPPPLGPLCRLRPTGVQGNQLMRHMIYYEHIILFLDLFLMHPNSQIVEYGFGMLLSFKNVIIMTNTYFPEPSLVLTFMFFSLLNPTMILQLDVCCLQ